jgi:hypothetical protein
MVIFENSQSVFQHPQHFLVFEGLMSSNLQLGDPFPLPVNDSAASATCRAAIATSDSRSSGIRRP